MMLRNLNNTNMCYRNRMTIMKFDSGANNRSDIRKKINERYHMICCSCIKDPGRTIKIREVKFSRRENRMSMIEWIMGKNILKREEKVEATKLTSCVDSSGVVCEWSIAKSYWYWVSVKENGDEGVEKLSLRTTWLAMDYCRFGLASRWKTVNLIRLLDNMASDSTMLINW